jgi:hypothetical protein
MLKIELKERWGAYCDTDKLVDDMILLLTKYNHECTEHGICSILDTYFANKKSLIDLFQTSETYVGNMRICVDVELERGINSDEIKTFCETFPKKVGAEDIFFKYVDENGKSLADYSRVGVRRLKARQLCYGNFADTFLVNSLNRKKFRHDGITIDSFFEYNKFWNMIYGFRYSPSTALTIDTLNQLTQYEINGKFVEGMKTSRAFNRVCALHGVDKLPNYNKLFAEY